MFAPVPARIVENIDSVGSCSRNLMELKGIKDGHKEKSQPKKCDEMRGSQDSSNLTQLGEAPGEVLHYEAPIGGVKKTFALHKI